jgi:hypothetical protein
MEPNPFLCSRSAATWNRREGGLPRLPPSQVAVGSSLMGPQRVNFPNVLMHVMSNSPRQKLATIPGMTNEVSRAWNQHHFINSVFNRPTLGGILPVNIAEKELEQCSNRIIKETARTRAGQPAPRVLPLPFASFAHPAQFAPRPTVIRSGWLYQSTSIHGYYFEGFGSIVGG